MRKWSIIAVLALFALVFAACGETDTEPVTKPVKAEVTEKEPTAKEQAEQAEQEALTENLALLDDMQRRNNRLGKLSEQGVRAAGNYNVDRICEISYEMEVLMDQQREDMDTVEDNVSADLKDEAQGMRDAFTEQEVGLRRIVAAASDLGC